MLVHIAVVKREHRVEAGLEEGVKSQGPVFQLREFRKTVAIVIKRVPHPVLSKHGDTRLTAIGKDRGVKRRTLLPTARAVVVERVIAHLARVANRLAGDDINNPSYGRRAKQRRAATPHHLHPLDHVGGNLLQAVNGSQRTHRGTGVNQYLRVGAFKPVNAYLREAAVLTVILHPQSRLKAQPLRQVAGVGDLQGFHIENGNQRRCQFPGGLVPVGRNHHLVERQRFGFQLEVQFNGLVFLEQHLLLHGFIPHELGKDSEPSYREVIDIIVSRRIGRGSHGCTFQLNGNVGQMLFRAGIQDMPKNVGIRFVPRNRGVIAFCVRAI